MMKNTMRDRIEAVIKDRQLERARIHEVPLLQYEAVIKRIEQCFVLRGGPLHWAGIEGRFVPSFPCKKQSSGKNRYWYRQLASCLPQQPYYVLFEDVKNGAPKYWVYEIFPQEIAVVLDETMQDDLYILPKKMNWLISECHEDVVYFVGNVPQMLFTARMEGQNGSY